MNSYNHRHKKMLPAILLAIAMIPALMPAISFAGDGSIPDAIGSDLTAQIHRPAQTDEEARSEVYSDGGGILDGSILGSEDAAYETGDSSADGGEPSVSQLEDNAVPLAPPGYTPEIQSADRPALAILNLMAMFLTLFLSVYLVASIFLKTVYSYARPFAIIPGICSILLFLITGSFSGPVQLADSWTIPMLAILATEAAYAFVILKFGSEESSPAEHGSGK